MKKTNEEELNKVNGGKGFFVSADDFNEGDWIIYPAHPEYGKGCIMKVEFPELYILFPQTQEYLYLLSSMIKHAD